MRPDYQSVILGGIPAGCEHAIDVGCGLGGLTRRLRTVVPHVVGIDKDHRSIECARAHPDRGDITYLHGDFLTWPFVPESFDLITATAALHHMDARAALERMRDLLRPGGVLAIVGLARGASPVDIALTVPAAIGARLHRLAEPRPAAEPDEYHSPVCWPPPVTYRDMRRLAGQLLPGSRYRRHLYWAVLADVVETPTAAVGRRKAPRTTPTRTGPPADRDPEPGTPHSRSRGARR